MIKNNLLNLSHFNILEIEGKGAEELLQGQLTCDMAKIEGNKFCLGSLCNVKGRVVSSFILCERPYPDDGKKYWLITNHDMSQKTQNVLNKYSPFYDVKLKLNNQFKFFAIDNKINPCIHEGIKNKENQYSESGGSVIFSYLDKELDLIVFLEDINEEFNIINDIGEWNLDNLRAKDVEITNVNSEKYTPHELNFNQNRIDFEKGCYTGQEIIARMQYRAKSLPKLYEATCESLVKVNEKVISSEDKNLGSVVLCSESEGKFYCLLSLKDFEYTKPIFLKDSKKQLEVKTN
jgi:folate-binding protein YgfZ|tara:strand:- start:1387 stop:2259 length:873 start_codon:yes stop_codon:yes gene_type:complete